MNTIVSLPIAAAVPVASPIATPPMSDASSVEAQMARLEQVVNVLRTRHVCEGWTLDEARAERALAYFRKGCPDDDEEWGSAPHFIASHGLSPNWILLGDPSIMIALSASLSSRAAAADPILEAIESHKRAHAAFNEHLSRQSDLEEELPKHLRQTAHSAWDGPKIVETDDPRWIAAEKASCELDSAETAAAIALIDIVPNTLAGAAALMRYVVERGGRRHEWPDSLVEDESEKWGRTWESFLHRNIAEVLEDAAGWSAMANDKRPQLSQLLGPSFQCAKSGG